MLKKQSNTIGNKVRKHPRLIWFLLIVLLIFSTVTFLPPIILHWQLKKSLKEQGEDQVKIDYVTFNPFLFQFRIHSLFAEKGESNHIQWNKMIFDINIWPIWKRRLVVDNFVLNNASVTLRHSGPGEWIFGGIRFRTGTTGTAKKGKKAWEFGLYNIKLTNVELTYVDSLIKQKIVITHAQIDTFMSWRKDKHTGFTVNSMINKGTIDISGSADPMGKNRSVSFQTKINSLQLHWLAPVLARYGLNSFKGILYADYSIKAHSSPDTESVVNALGKLTLRDVTTGIPVFPFSISVSELSINGNNNIIGNNRISTANQVFISNAICKDTVQNLLLLNVNNIRLNAANYGNVTHITNWTINNLNSLSKYEPDDTSRNSPFALVMNTFTIDTASLDSSRLYFGNATIQQLGLILTRMQDRNFMYFKQLSEYFKTSSKSPPSKKNPFQVHLNKLTINNKSRITFNDLSTSPIVDITAADADISLRNLTIQGKSPGEFTINATVDTFADLYANGTIISISQGVTTALNSRLQQFNLVNISPYLKDLFGYDFKTGHLNAALDGTIKSNKLDLNSAITVREVTVSPIDTAEAYKKFRNIFLGVSFQTALNILTNNKGDVHLNIPISGDLKDPSFNITDVIRTATFNGLKGGISTFFGAVGDVFTPDQKTVFKPVIFEVQSTSMTANDTKYLDSLAKRMLKHPDIPVNLCGIAAITEFDKNLKNSDSLNQIQKNQLLNLAQKRSTVVKTFLIKRKVPSSQLFLCAPQVDDSKKAQPRVEIKLGIKSVE